MGLECYCEVIDDVLYCIIWGWIFDQMVQIDFNVLCFVIYELMYIFELYLLVIESVVWIVCKFGGDDLGCFVNGVLVGLLCNLCEEVGESLVVDMIVLVLVDMVLVDMVLVDLVVSEFDEFCDV